MRKLFLVHIIFFGLVLIFSASWWPNTLLILAQLVLIPVMFLAIVEQGSIFKSIYPFIAIPAYLAIAAIAIFPSAWNGILSLIYLIFTCYIATYGLSRFIQRGFIQIEEFVIDCGFVFLAVGGLWFTAYEMGVDTGFSPLITWLTAIHFHYSFYLMSIYIGLLGRIRKNKYYPYLAMLMVTLPWLMAIGISLSSWIELIGIIFYIITVHLFIIYAIQTKYDCPLQGFLISLSFATIGLTIIFASFYVLGHFLAIPFVTIDWMLYFHGITNAFLFGLLGCIGWLIKVPTTNWKAPQFPLSSIRNKFNLKLEGKSLSGLVDHMEIYEPFVERDSLARTVTNFYEQTEDYDLYASVYWHRWFKPLALVYRQISRLIEQINLPLSSKRVKMSGKIYPIDEGIEGRENVRAWIRKIDKETVFVALYSYHTEGRRTYMNIALPLPFTSMHGILALNQVEERLELTSERKDNTMKDSGIYLAFGKQIRFRLPLAETFCVRETAAGKLEATHQMKIANIRFLTIHYHIVHQFEG